MVRESTLSIEASRLLGAEGGVVGVAVGVGEVGAAVQAPRNKQPAAITAISDLVVRFVPFGDTVINGSFLHSSIVEVTRNGGIAPREEVEYY
jgi:hypothetical protein